MKNGTFSAKRLCRSGVIAALYVAFTVSFGNLSFFGGLQVRPSEGLCMLPLLYPDAILALTVGCFLSNLFSPFVVFDVTLGVLATLLAALCTWGCGKLTFAAYIAVAGEVALSEAIWVYAVGTPLTLFCMKQQEKKVALFE